MRPRTEPMGRGLGLLLVGLLLFLAAEPPATAAPSGTGAGTTTTSAAGGPVANFSAAVNRVVTLLGVSGGGLLAIVWARVALSWFSHDVTKKVQAKERARDALIGTLLFTAAITGLIWGLAHWVLTGS